MNGVVAILFTILVEETEVAASVAMAVATDTFFFLLLLSLAAREAPEFMVASLWICACTAVGLVVGLVVGFLALVLVIIVFISRLRDTLLVVLESYEVGLTTFSCVLLG